MFSRDERDLAAFRRASGLSGKKKKKNQQQHTHRKEDTTVAPGLIPGLGRAPAEGNGNPLQYSCLGNPMDRVAWRATAHGVTESQIRLNERACMNHLGSLSYTEYNNQGRNDWLFCCSLAVRLWASHQCSPGPSSHLYYIK